MGFEDLFDWTMSGSHYLIIVFDKEGEYIGYKIVLV